MTTASPIPMERILSQTMSQDVSYPDPRINPMKLMKDVKRMKMDYITKFGPCNFTAKTNSPVSSTTTNDYLPHIPMTPFTLTPTSLRRKTDKQFRKLEDELFCLKSPTLMTSTDGSKTLQYTFAEEKQDRPFPCHLCPKSFMAQKTLTLHLRTHQVESDASPTPDSSTDSDSSPSPPHHASSHVSSSSSSLLHACDVCQKTFMQKSNLDRHRLIHFGIQAFKCDQCDKAFTQKAGLTRHLASHAGIKEFTCLECGKQFTRRSTLYTHLVTRHLGEKPFHCDVCNMFFTSATNFRTHTRRVHSKEALKHECEVCRKKFFQNSDLTRHMRTHTGEKPYTCEKCHKSWTQSNGLKRHMQKFHST